VPECVLPSLETSLPSCLQAFLRFLGEGMPTVFSHVILHLCLFLSSNRQKSRLSACASRGGIAKTPSAVRYTSSRCPYSFVRFTHGSDKDVSLQAPVVSDGLAGKMHTHGSRPPGGIPCRQAWRGTAKTIEDGPNDWLHPQGRPGCYAGRSEEDQGPAECHDNIGFAKQGCGPRGRRRMPACDIGGPRHTQHDRDE